MSSTRAYFSRPKLLSERLVSKATIRTGKSTPIHVRFCNNCVPYEKRFKISYHFDFPGTAFVRKLKPCCHGPIQRLIKNNQLFIQATDTTGIPPCRRKHLTAQFTITRETRFALVREHTKPPTAGHGQRQYLKEKSFFWFFKVYGHVT